eukprot:scaffold256273_cov40-Tisochrysis_lutea.AAC.1
MRKGAGSTIEGPPSVIASIARATMAPNWLSVEQAIGALSSARSHSILVCGRKPSTARVGMMRVHGRWSTVEESISAKTVGVSERVKTLPQLPVCESTQKWHMSDRWCISRYCRRDGRQVMGATYALIGTSRQKPHAVGQLSWHTCIPLVEDDPDGIHHPVCILNVDVPDVVVPEACPVVQLAQIGHEDGVIVVAAKGGSNVGPHEPVRRREGGRVR